jgi:hypothetical protein
LEKKTQYHVLLGGRTVGPYDRRTIIGMRIRNALAGEHVLVGAEGAQLTVDDLIRSKRPEPFNPNRSGSYSLVQATFTSGLVEVEGAGLAIPRFRGEVETRVQSDVLRLAGRFRLAFAWKEDRVKVPLKSIVHARVRNSLVDLWLQPVAGAAAGRRLQRLTLELFTPESAGELVDWLPDAKPWPGGRASPVVPVPYALLGALTAVFVVVVLVLVAVLARPH